MPNSSTPVSLPKTPVVPPTTVNIKKRSHELVADLQDCIGVTSNAIDGLIQLGFASGAYEVALWLSNHTYEGLKVLSIAMCNTHIDSELTKLLRDSEKVCTLISVSCSVDDDEAEELLLIANELLAGLSNKTLHVFNVLTREFETEAQV